MAHVRDTKRPASPGAFCTCGAAGVRARHDPDSWFCPRSGAWLAHECSDLGCGHCARQRALPARVLVPARRAA